MQTTAANDRKRFPGVPTSSRGDRRSPHLEPTRCASELIELFNQTFLPEFGAELVSGDGDPVYLPADEESPYHRIVFAHGFFASALHEIAHWCIAGKRRRGLQDYGYWYKPDGRTLGEQKCFEQVEIKPQALEWMFSVACGARFVFSADNLNGTCGDMTNFHQAVHQQVGRYLMAGLPSRAHRWFQTLAHYYRQDPSIHSARLNEFKLENVR